MTSRQSDIFNNNFMFWKVFGLWAGRKPRKFYKYYSFVYLSITLFMYNILLTLNLAYTPPKIENLIREVIFYFTEIAVTSKVFMIIIMRDKILQAFNLIDGGELDGDDEASKQIIAKDNANYKTFFKLFAIMSHIAYSTQVVIPILLRFIIHTKLELPICMYYFLSDDFRDRHFIFWFIYQSWGMYGHMTYNVTIDSFIAGLLIIAITQLKVLNNTLTNFQLNDMEKKLTLETQNKIQMLRLRSYLKRYDKILEYCELIQEIMSVTMFIVFGISTLIICVVLCGILLPSTTETFVFMFMYLFAMTLQIFLPGYLGTLLYYESKEIMYAAYCTEWIPRSEPFKKSLIIFIGRANKPIQMTGLQMFPLSLTTFTSIMKTAYSFFTLISSFQDS